MNIYPAERLNMGISAGAIAASFAFATPHFASSLALGAAIEAVNFRFLHRASELLFHGVMSGGGPWVGVLGMRMGILSGGLIAALVAGADALGLVIGLSLAMPATVISALRHRPEIIEQPLADVPAPDDPSWDEFNVWRAGLDGPEEEEREASELEEKQW
jgi:hypothetical protein